MCISIMHPIMEVCFSGQEQEFLHVLLPGSALWMKPLSEILALLCSGSARTYFFRMDTGEIDRIPVLFPSVLTFKKQMWRQEIKDSRQVFKYRFGNQTASHSQKNPELIAFPVSLTSLRKSFDFSYIALHAIYYIPEMWLPLGLNMPNASVTSMSLHHLRLFLLWAKKSLDNVFAIANIVLWYFL